MPNKSSSKRTLKSPFLDWGTITDASYLIKNGQEPRNATFIQKLLLKPAEQRRIPLGNFTNDIPPKGFLVEVDPDPKPTDSILTKVISLGSSTQYSLFLDIANYGPKPFAAEIWEL